MNDAIITHAKKAIMREQYLREFNSKFLNSWFWHSEGFRFSTMEDAMESFVLYCAGYNI